MRRLFRNGFRMGVIPLRDTGKVLISDFFTKPGCIVCIVHAKQAKQISVVLMCVTDFTQTRQGETFDSLNYMKNKTVYQTQTLQHPLFK